MAVTAIPVFAQGMSLDTCALTTANGSTLLTPTNTVLLSTAGANGSEYNHISVLPNATNSATNAQLYLSATGSTFALIGMATVAAQTLATTTALTPIAFNHIDGTQISEANPLRVQATWRLYVAIGVTTGLNALAQRKDY